MTILTNGSFKNPQKNMDSMVSILIPVFNRESIIAETIQSALDQTHKNIEVVIVDNTSTDNTWSEVEVFAKRDKRIKAFRNETNLGPVRNWLRCVEEAKGEYGKILWSDDLIAPEFVEKTLPLFNEDVGFVYTGANIFTGQHPHEAKTSYLLPETGQYPSSIYLRKAIFDRGRRTILDRAKKTILDRGRKAILDRGMPVSPGCAIFRMKDIRKNLWLQIPNKVNSDFSMHAIGSDLLLFLLTANDYQYFGHIAEPLAFFRSHKGSITASSASGKMFLHYALARAFFVENYQPESINCLASYIQLLLWRFKDAKTYGMQSANDFFQAPVQLSKWCLIKEWLIRLMH